MSKFQNLLSQDEIASFPLKHISLSCMRQFMTDQMAFKKKYIENIWDPQEPSTFSEGKATHEVIAKYWESRKNEEQGFDWGKHCDEAIYTYLQKPDEDKKIDWGKNGDFEKSRDLVKKLVTAYQSETPKYVPLMIEQSMNEYIKDSEGVLMPLPIKGVVDLLAYDENGELALIDHKTVTRYSNGATIAYELQATVYDFLVRSRLRKEVAYVQFDEIKKSRNRDGSPQIQSVKVVVTDEMRKTFLELYKRMILAIKLASINGFVFLPNPFSVFGGKESWDHFKEEVKMGLVAQ